MIRPSFVNYKTKNRSASVAHHSQQHQKQIDKIEVESQGTDNTGLVPTFTIGKTGRADPFDFLCIVGGETNGYWRIMGCGYSKSVSIDDSIQLLSSGTQALR